MDNLTIDDMHWDFSNLQKKKPEATGKTRVATEALRAGAERAKPGLAAVLRVGSGFGSGMGGWPGAAISGAGETLAQIAEGARSYKDLNKGRIVAEAGLGALPAHAFFTAGKAGVSALKGAGMGLGSTLARKTADVVTGTDPEALSNWSGYDLLPAALGGTMSGAIGKLSKAGPAVAKAETVVKTPPAPQRADDVLRTGKWKPEQVEAEIARADAIEKTRGGQPNPYPSAEELRAVATKTGTGTQKVSEDVTKAAAATSAKAAAEKEAQRLREMGAPEDTAVTLEPAGKGAGVKTTLSTKAARMEARKAAQAVRAEKMADNLIAAGGKAKTTVKVVSKGEGGNKDITATTIIAKGKPKKSEGGSTPTGDIPTGPRGPAEAAPIANTPTPIPGTFQIMDSTGKVVRQFDNAEDTLASVNTLGPGHTVIPPAEQLTGKVPAATESTPTPAPAPFNPIRGLESPQAPTATIVPEVTQPPAATASKPTEAPSAPQVVSVAETGPAPTLARIFRNLGQDDTQSFLQDVVGKYKAAPGELPAEVAGLPSKERRAMRDALPKRQLGALLSKMQRDLNLPRMTEPPVPSPQAVTAGPVDLEQVMLSRLGRAEQAGQQIPEGLPKATPPPTVEAPQVRPMDSPADNAVKGFQTVSTIRNLAAAGKGPAALREKVGQYLAAADSIEKLGLPDTDPRVAYLYNKLETEFEPQVLMADLQKLGPRGRKGGTSVSFMGLGGNNILELAKQNPEFAQQLLGGVVGAGIGSQLDENDPIGSALLGGAVGAMAPRAFRAVTSGMGAPPDTPGLSLGSRINNFQQGALLSHPGSMAINMAAPTGGGTLGSLEQILTGKVASSPLAQRVARSFGKDLGDPGNAEELGKAGLRAVLDPKRFTPKVLGENVDAAVQRIGSSEERTDMQFGGGTPSAWDKAVAVPAVGLMAADIGVQDALIHNAGWPEELARNVTVTTKSPRTKAGNAVVNFAKTNNLTKFALPFSRTAVNTIEGSLERIPLLGFIPHMMRSNPAFAESLAQQVAEQGMGAAVGTGSYILGQSLDPTTVKQWKVLSALTNMTGQYGALAASAFLAGQSARAGKTLPEQAGKFATSFVQQTPLPTAESINDIIDAGQKTAQGDLTIPKNLRPRAYDFFKNQLAGDPLRFEF